MENLKKIGKTLFYGLFILGFLWVISQLFFNFRQVNTGVGGQKNTMAELKIVYPTGPSTLEPTKIDSVTRQILINIYEPLVKMDRSFNTVPDLALSWGLIDDNTWEFKLRPNVLFHDGSTFDSDDASASIRRAMIYKDSEMKDLFVSIKEVNVLDDLNLQIVTSEPDPLLLQKLSLVLMVPSEVANGGIKMPVGTAFYKLYSWDKQRQFVFEKFMDYWGEKAKFEKVTTFVQTDKLSRVKMLLNGDVDFLAFVPYDALSTLEKNNFQITSVPSLELQFILFNMKSNLLKNVQNRKIISMALDPNALVETVGGYALTENQFVSNGIFGFNPKLSDHLYDLWLAKELAEPFLKGKTLIVHLAQGMDVLGEYIRTQMAEIGVNAAISYMELQKLLESIKATDADIYFMAYKSDLATSSEFFKNVAVTGGEFNIGKYSNKNLDFLIAKSSKEMDPKVRRNDLQEAMKIVVEDDVIGVPLFEYETVYSFTGSLKFNSRLDGFIYFDDIDIK